MHPTPLPEINHVLTKLVAGQRAILGEKLLAIYLSGSFALGDWDEYSDVDWIAIIDQDLGDNEVTALNKLHTDFVEKGPEPWGRVLEGSYWPHALLPNDFANAVDLW
jgi:predicted nucleotidyltransferase